MSDGHAWLIVLQRGQWPAVPSGHSCLTRLQWGGVPVVPSGQVGCLQLGHSPVVPFGHAWLIALRSQCGGVPVVPSGQLGCVVEGPTGRAVPEVEDLGTHLWPFQNVPSAQLGAVCTCTQRGGSQVYPGGHVWMGGGTTGSAIPEDVGGATGSAVPEDEDPHLSPVQTVPSGQFGVLSLICTQRGETQVYPGRHA